MSERNESSGVIEPASFSLDAGEAPDAGGQLRRTLRFGAIAGGLAVLLFALFVVVFVLPQWVGEAETVAGAARDEQRVAGAGADDADARADAQTGPEPSAPGALVEKEPASPEARKDTQQLLRAALEKLDALTTLKADNWAKTEVHEIRQTIAEGEKAYREKRYNAARNSYLDVADRIERVLAEIPDFLGKLVDAGYLALDNGDSAQATNAFTQALEIDAEHERARKGLARAETLDQVLALIGQAEGYERLGQRKEATDAYRAALELDADATGAAAAIARLDRARRGDAFRAAMSKGFAALERQDFKAAKAAFASAAKNDSASGEAAAALEQTKRDEAAFLIARSLERGRAAVSKEDWNSAIKHYEAALSIDARVSPALAGKHDAETRRRAEARLAAYLARPERLATEKVRDEADEALSDARKIKQPGERQRGQMAALERALTEARTPVTIGLVSNSETAITIYRVGELGRFQSREVSLLPGAYTAIGKRDGYRDVRVEFSVSPGEQGRLITIQCDEKFAFGS